MTEPAGHRQRLKQRFQQAQGAGLADYELVELVLTYALPRRDVKPLAKQLLSHFGSLHGLLTAAPEALANTPGLGQHTAVLLQLVGSLAKRVGKTQLSEKPVLSNQIALLDYLYTRFAGLPREEVHVLYLDVHHHLMAEETLFTGTLTQSAASPRDVLQRALARNAAGIVIAHNHPSGKPHPSRADDDFTHALDIACCSLGIQLHDHIIIGENEHYSFKDNRKL